MNLKTDEEILGLCFVNPSMLTATEKEDTIRGFRKAEGIAREYVSQLKAENEKLSAQRNNGKVIVQYLDANNYEEYDSFQEAKEAILESFTDKHEGIHPDIECIKVLQEIYKIEVPENPDGTYSINFVPTKVSDELSQARTDERARIVTEIDNQILWINEHPRLSETLNNIQALYKLRTAITADQPKSCEGCEHIDSPTSSLIETFGKCIYKSNYQPKEK